MAASIDERLRAAGLPPLPRTAWIRIDVDALTANLASLRAAVGSGVRVEPVVKADAYGHGAVETARILAGAGADGFCVATLDEALELRRGGIMQPILVLYPVPARLAPEAAREGITLSVGDPEQLARVLAEVRVCGTGTILDVELQVETGLGRDGVAGAELGAAALAVSEGSAARLVGVWTHLQAAADRERTGRQLARFDAACERLETIGLLPRRRHVAASAGLAIGSVAGFDAVRPGLITYGIVPEDVPAPLPPLDGVRAVLSLHARPVRVADLPAGWGISYGPTFETTRPSRIATLPVGYGDGWSRARSNRADALVRGVRVPIVGTVSMDAIMVDVTDVPSPPVGLDDEFVLIGRQGREEITVHDLAARDGTITWEVVTALTRRLPRVYDAASGPEAIRTLTSTGMA